MTTIKGALPGALLPSGRRWTVLLSCGHQTEIIVPAGRAPRGAHECEICALLPADDAEVTGPMAEFLPQPEDSGDTQGQ